MRLRTSNEKTCIRCGKKFLYIGNGVNVKYCNICINFIHQLRNMKIVQHPLNALGTSGFSSNMVRDKKGNPDFIAEHHRILKELRNLKLKTD